MIGRFVPSLKIALTILIAGISGYPPTYALHPEIDHLLHVVIVGIIAYHLIRDTSIATAVLLTAMISLLWEAVEVLEILHLRAVTSPTDTAVDLAANAVGLVIAYALLKAVQRLSERRTTEEPTTETAR